MEFKLRDGTIITDVLTWATEYEKSEVRHVKNEVLPNGRFVSTIWEGMVPVMGIGLIYETVAFSGRDLAARLDEERTEDEESALACHARMVEKWS